MSINLHLAGWTVKKSGVSGVMKVYPLFAPIGRKKVEYVWAGDAMASGSVEVTEGTGEQSLHLRNRGSSRVLFLEGLVLDRGHQNRGVNSSLMVPAMKELYLPVSCVEKKRSTGASTVFGCSGSFVPSSVRATLKGEVSRSLSVGQGPHTHRNTVWQSISNTLDTSQTVSETESIVEVHRTHRVDLQNAARSFPYVAGASGIAFAIGRTVVGIELFDDPETCKRLWKPLVEAFAISGFGVPPNGAMVTRHDIAALLQSFQGSEWIGRSAEPGEGTDYRVAFGNHCGSALVVDNSLIHASVVMAA